MFLADLMDIINTCNDECQLVDCYSFAHIGTIMDKLVALGFFVSTVVKR